MSTVVSFDRSSIVSSPLLTTLVKGFGPTDSALRYLAPEVPVPNYVFEYMEMDTSHLLLQDAERPFGASYTRVTPNGRLVSDSLKHYGKAGTADARELASASAPGGDPMFQARRANIARLIVETAIEKVGATLFASSGNYAASLAIAGGSEWNAAGGDAKTDINTAAASILAATGIPKNRLRVFMPPTTLEAAKADPVFLAARVATTFREAGQEELAAYYGVAGVDTANPIYTTTGDFGQVPTAMYGDVAIVYVPLSTGYDRMTGGPHFGVNFVWNPGIALVPRVDENGIWLYPYDKSAAPKIINSAAGYLITNCAA